MQWSETARVRAHPVLIVETIYRQLYLLLIPLVRGLLSIYSAASFYAWLQGAWVDILVLLFILTASFLNWLCQSYTADESGMTVRKGVIVRRVTTIPAASLSTLMCYEPFYLRPLKAVRVYADTDAGTFRRADCQITIGRREAEALIGSQHPQRSDAPVKTYRPKWYDIAFLSVFVSSTFTGVVFLVTFFSKAGELFGNDFRDKLISQLEGVARLIAFIPTAAAVLALLIFIAWLIGFIHSFLSYIRFSVRREGNMLRVQYGWLSKRRYSCRSEAVNFIDYRQSMLSKLLRLSMVFIHCAGYAKSKDEHAVLIPASDDREVRRTIRRLLPEFQRSPRQLRPPRGSVVRYAMLPFWCSVLIPVCTAVAARLFSFWASLIVFVGAMTTVPFVWLLLVKIVDCHTAGLAVSRRHVTLYYTLGYAFHTVVVPREKINYIQLRSSVFQRWSGNCDVILYTYSETVKRHQIGNLRLSEVTELLEKNGLLSKTV